MFFRGKVFQVKLGNIAFLFKACVRYFHQISIFSPSDSPLKTVNFCRSLFFYLSAITLEGDRR